jgi:peptidyl-prolyl cis-trans isomerase C
MKPDNNFFFHTAYLLAGIALAIATKTVHSAENMPSPAASSAASKVLVEVNGRKITDEMLQRYVKFRGIPKGTHPEQQKKMMLEELINRELIYLDALDKGVDKIPQVQADVENQKVNVVAGAMLRETTKNETFTDQELKQAYDDYIKKMPPQVEFKARHILLKDEKSAKEVIAELDKGADFIELTKKKSTEPEGGDLGWFQASQMIKPFSDALVKLKNGEYTKTPIHTQYGWHVVLREDSRKAEPPSFESLKGQFRMRLMNKTVETYIKSLRDKAKITRY